MPKLPKNASKAKKKKRMSEEMKKFDNGALRSGGGNTVKSRQQAIAISLSEAGEGRKKKKK